MVLVWRWAPQNWRSNHHMVQYTVRCDMMIKLIMCSSCVKLNIMLNQAGLLLISIYINNMRCRIQQQQHHFGEMSAYHAPPARLVKNDDLANDA